MPKQVASQVFEGLKDQAKDVGKAIKREPLNIVKEMLGDSSDDPADMGAKKAVKQKPVRQPQNVQAQKLQQLQQEEEMERQKRLVALRQQKNKLEQAEVGRKQREQELLAKEQEEKQEGKDKEQQGVVQLRKAEEKESVLKKQIKSKKGTREMGPRKKF